MDLTQLALQADKILESSILLSLTLEYSVNAVRSSNSLENLQKQMTEIQKQIKKLAAPVNNRSRERSKKSRSTGSLERLQIYNKAFCHNHKKYGAECRNCNKGAT